MPIWGAILVAVAATILLNFGFALQKRGVALAAERPDASERQAARLFRTRVWRTGLAVMSGGWGLYLFAARHAPISIVQPALGAGFVVLALFSVFYLKEKIRWLEWAALAAMLAGIVLLGWSATGEETPARPDGTWLLGFTAVVVAAALAAHMAEKTGMLRRIRSDVLWGVSAGVLIGLGSTHIKAMFNFIGDGRDAVAFGVCLPAAIVLSVAGIAMIQAGFRRGKALVVVPLQQVTNKVVAIAGGMIALGERLPDDPAAAGMRVAALVLILFGAGALARFGGEEIAERIS